MFGMTPRPAREGQCSEKARLLHEYEVAAADYSQAVLVLSERSGVMSKDEYTTIREFTEHARARSEAARGALDRHVTDHGC